MATLKAVVFGKGGIGKSTVCANLAVVYAQQGQKVLVVGCDPKHDTTLYLTRGRSIPTVLSSPSFKGGVPEKAGLVFPGALGIDCVEAGGPEPGLGCAGRGITRMSELLKAAGVVDDARYDVILYDVLGDVVCGGFAAPLREGFAEKVAIVTSEELMAMYAANNIARAIRNNAGHGSALFGLVANVRDPGADSGTIARFADRIGTRVISTIPRDPLVREAEFQKMTVAEYAPDSAIAGVYRDLARTLRETPASSGAVPKPMSDEDFHELSRQRFQAAPPDAPSPPPARRPPPPAESAEAWRRFHLSPAFQPGPGRLRGWEEERLNAEAAAARFESLRNAGTRPGIPARPRTVNLLGLPEGRAGEECAALLEGVGVAVNARLLPRFHLEEARRFGAASQTVAHEREGWGEAMRPFLAAAGGAALTLPVPYGLGRSRRWLAAIAGLFGMEGAAERVWSDREAAQRAVWEDLRSEASRHRLAFVVDAGWPSALLAVVQELGFGADLIVYAGKERGLPRGGGLRSHRFSSPEELDSLLENGAFAAVYSDFPLDPRLERNRKAQFSLAQFEPGPDGCLRTLRRLLQLASRPTPVP